MRPSSIQVQLLDIDDAADVDAPGRAGAKRLRVADAALRALLGGRATVAEADLVPLLAEAGAIEAVRIAEGDEGAADGAGDGEVTCVSDAVGVAARWQAAQRKATEVWLNTARFDPWADRGITHLPTELALRHDYNAATRTWSTMEMLIKMEREPFAEGAMRQCYRLKKLSQQPGSKACYSMDWEHASNYVAKQYKQEGVGREAYADDVVLQMESKLWAERFNDLDPPKKVDFLQGSYFEMPNRAACGEPSLFAVERLVEGEYIKHNNNSGFVDEHMRTTPQLFSHFTYHASGGELIIVDIQGVGDLYTDPQIHSRDKKNYGEGNLGVRGFAHFFSTYVHRPLASRLGLPRFPLAPLVAAALATHSAHFATPSSTLDARTALGTVRSCEARAVETRERAQAVADLVVTLDDLAPFYGDAPESAWGCSDEGAGEGEGAVALDAQRLAHQADVHFELARLHGCGQAACNENQLPDPAAALFHLCSAAAGAPGVPCVEACAALKCLLGGQEWANCPELSVDTSADPGTASALVQRLTREMASRGDRDAALELAGLATSADDEVHYLQLAANVDGWGYEQDVEAAAFGNAQYQVLERLARALLARGGEGDAARAAEAAAEGAERAMELLKPKVAMKLEALAEEASALVEDD